MHANLNKYQVENCPALPGRNLIFTLKFHPGKPGSCNHHPIVFTSLETGQYV